MVLVWPETMSRWTDRRYLNISVKTAIIKQDSLHLKTYHLQNNTFLIHLYIVYISKIKNQAPVQRYTVCLHSAHRRKAWKHQRRTWRQTASTRLGWSTRHRQPAQTRYYVSDGNRIKCRNVLCRLVLQYLFFKIFK